MRNEFQLVAPRGAFRTTPALNKPEPSRVVHSALSRHTPTTVIPDTEITVVKSAENNTGRRNKDKNSYQGRKSTIQPCGARRTTCCSAASTKPRCSCFSWGFFLFERRNWSKAKHSCLRKGRPRRKRRRQTSVSSSHYREHLMNITHHPGGESSAKQIQTVETSVCLIIQTLL